MSKCTLCSLHETAVHSNCIPGTGASNPDWLFVGEAPGKYEDREGKNFVGATGQALRRELVELEFDLRKCRFTNVNRCWPGPGNPTPTLAQLRACFPFLEDEIEKHDPKVVVLLGANTLKAFRYGRGPNAITRARGRVWLDDEGRFVLITFHPSYALGRAGGVARSHFLSDLELAYNLRSRKLEHPPTTTLKRLPDVKRILDRIADDPGVMGIDFETTTANAADSNTKILTTGVCWDEQMGYCFPVDKSDSPLIKHATKIRSGLSKALQNRSEKKLPWEAYNAVFEFEMAWKILGVWMEALYHDPYLAYHLIDGDVTMPNLDEYLVWRYTPWGGYDHAVRRYVLEHSEANPRLGGSYDAIPFDILAPYNAADAVCTPALRRRFVPALEESSLLEFAEMIVFPSTYFAGAYEMHGLAVDMRLVDRYLERNSDRKDEILAELRDMPAVKKLVRRRRKKDPKYEFEIKDGAVRELLFDVLGLPVLRLTDKTKVASVDRNVRAALADRHPAAGLLDEEVRLKKLDGTYLKKFRTKAKPEGNGAVHLYRGYYHLEGTKSGRMGSDLQQFPRVGTYPQVRECLVSRWTNGVLVEMDVNQGELRVVAALSGDVELINAFARGDDLHTVFASEGFGVPVDQVTSELRSKGKSAVGFGIMYLRGEEALARDLNITEKEAEEFIDRYFTRFNGVKKYIDKVLDETKLPPHVSASPSGRVRYLPDIVSGNGFLRSDAERRAFNHRIQAGLHDMMMDYQVHLLELFRRLKFKSVLCAEWHDGIIADCVPEEVRDVVKLSQLVARRLTRLPRYEWFRPVELVVDVKAGRNLKDLVEI